MISRREALATLAGAASLLAGCERLMVPWFDPMRYRLTAEVETPTGVNTRSSVIEVRWDKGLSGSEVHGQAVAVDVAPGQALFVLLRSAASVDWAAEMHGYPVQPDPPVAKDRAERVAQVAADVARMRADRALHVFWDKDAPPERLTVMPYMVRFRDIADPGSVELVVPTDLAKSFGPGFALRRVTVQTTEEAVTTGIEKRLEWLSRIHGPLIDGTTIGHVPNGQPLPFAVTIGTADFVKEMQ